jgi:Zn-dependent protease with chaperone function
MTGLAGLADTYGRLVVAWLGTMNMWTLVLLAGALALDHLLARRVRASWRIALYAPLALRLVIPSGWSLRVGHAPRLVTMLTPVPVDLPAPPPYALAGPALGWPALAFAAYVVVAAGLAVVMQQRRWSSTRMLRSCRPVQGELANLALPCPLLEHPQLGPMVVGLLSPRIVLPARLLAIGDAFALASVLQHEAAHLQRRDPWLSAAMQLVLVVAWPVLPLWVAGWRVRQLMELACDEWVLAAADDAERVRYGHALLDLAEWRSVALTPAGAELHFGSTLRARIEAMVHVSSWPRAIQGGVVTLAVAGFAACSSIGPGSTSTSDLASAGTRTQAWSPPAGGEIRSRDELLQYCGPLFDVPWRSAFGRDDRQPGDVPPPSYRVPIDGLPAEQVAFCRSSAVRDFVKGYDWANEARNAIGQIAKDTAASYEARLAAGTSRLCPSGAPVPEIPQAEGKKFQTTCDAEWNDSAGWQCLRFCMDAPFFFRYELVSDGRSFKAIAHGQRRNYRGELVDVTMSLSGHVDEKDVLWIAPNIEEVWKVTAG